MSPPSLTVALPRSWPERVQLALLTALALAHRGMIAVRGWCADSRLARVRLKAEVDRLRFELEVEREIARLNDARWQRIAPHKRPHFRPEERFDICALKALTGWTTAELARRMHIAPLTLSSWLGRLDEGGAQALLRLRQAVNRFPDFVCELIYRLKQFLPAMGKVRIAQLLARCGLHLAPSTVGRMLRKPRPQPPRRPAAAKKRSGRTVIARRPNHVWGVDLSVVSTARGWWVPWVPNAILPLWPFAWWLAVVVDHFSRRVLALGVYRSQPSAVDVCRLLDEARRRAGGAPKYSVTDQGAQFRDDYRAWCVRWHVKPRYGAIGKYGSVALVERFWRSLKEEAFGFVLCVPPLGLCEMSALCKAYVGWFNEWRPHQALGGRTPHEVFEGVLPAHRKPRLEPRARYPARAACARPRVPVRGNPGVKLELIVSHPEQAPHLPLVELNTAA